jgi:hypothetical protein
MALAIGRRPGDWYGPQAISIVLKDLNKNFQPFENFKMIVFIDAFIYWDKILKKANGWKNSVYVVIPLRLGLETINNEYL